VLHVGDQALNIQELRHRGHLFRFFVDHYGRTNSAVRMAAARNLSPIALGPVNHVGEIGKSSHQRKREPVARRFRDADLIPHIVCKVGERVTLLQTTLFGDQLVTAGERYRLKRDERDLLRILECEPNDRSDLVVVDSVYKRGYEDDVDAGFVKIVDRTKLYVEQVTDLTMRVRIIADAVELQIYESQSSFGRLTAKFFRLGEFDTIRRRLNRVVSNLTRIPDRV
jgi:hypothetical protein